MDLCLVVPLQTMQLYALGTGSFVMGALSMFAFSIGTVPLMLGFGYISSRLSKSLSNNIFKYKWCIYNNIRSFYGTKRFSANRN